MTSGPVRASRLPVAWRCAPRGASRPFLGRTAGVLRIRFYNRRLLTSTRRENTLFGDCPPNAVGKPAVVPLRDPPRERRFRRLRSRQTPDHLAVIRPPTAPCLTARRRLRAERLPRRALALRGESAAALSAASHASPFEPSDASSRLKRGARKRFCLHSPTSSPHAARQCSMLPRGRGAFHRGSPGRAPLRAPVRSATPAGRRARPLHVFIDVRKLRLDPGDALLSRAFSGRVRFHDFCRSMFQRALRWTARTSRASGKPWPGRLSSRSIVAFRSRTAAEGTRGQGQRNTVPRPSPPGLLPRETSPQPRSLQTPRVAVIACLPVRS